MGIFSKWRVFSKPEVLLEECIKDNPFHPFRLLDGAEAHAARPGIDSLQSNVVLHCLFIKLPLYTVYIYACRLKRFYGALLVCLASLLFVIIWPAAGGDAVSVPL